MKNTGIVLLCLGGAMMVGGLNVAFTKYDLTNSHDLSKFFGALGISCLIMVVGLILLRAGAGNDKRQSKSSVELSLQRPEEENEVQVEVLDEDN
jgi:hypothetical protein